MLDYKRGDLDVLKVFSEAINIYSSDTIVILNRKSFCRNYNNI